MTNKQKIAILKKMIDRIKSGKNTFLCTAYEDVTGCWPYKNELTNLGVRQPSKKYSPLGGYYWWSPFVKNPELQRLRALRYALKRLQK